MSIMSNVIELNGNWILTDCLTGKTYPACVPGCNYGDLQAADVIPNPFLDVNEKATAWVSERDWIYQKQFDVPQSVLTADKIVLFFERLDTICKVYLNGNEIANTANAHVSYEFDIKGILRQTNNDLRVEFASPVNHVLQKQKQIKCPVNSNGLTGIAHLRKPQCHFGWDWGPVIPISGITGKVSVKAFNYGRISDVFIKQFHADGVSVKADVKVENYGSDNLALRAVLYAPSGEKQEYIMAAKGQTQFDFAIENPLLWQPNGATERTEQPLYQLDIELLNSDMVVDRQCKKIGLRTISLDLTKDEYGQNFSFSVNGNKVFCKGASVIPFDSYPERVTDDDVIGYVKIAADSGFNMLRIWGGGEYGSEAFYDACDRYGILVWQDFAFACQGYPFFDDEFLANVKNEIAWQVKRLSHRASLALLCGNNEIEAMSMAWINRKEFISSAKQFFHQILPSEVRKINDFTPFIAGSPLGESYMKKNGSDLVGDTHLWAVWHGFQPIKFYRKRFTRFCSEFGFESLPDLRTIEGFYSDSTPKLDGEAFLSHQKCRGGDEKMRFYITENYRLPQNVEDLGYLSQICQAACIADATEHWRRNFGRCNGALYWQYNDCWPTCSWSGIDYFGRFKALQYEAKRFFEPFTLSIQDEKTTFKVFLLNDKIVEQNGILTVEVADFDGNVLFSETNAVSVPKTSSKTVWQGNVKRLVKGLNTNNAVFVATLESDGKKQVKTALFKKEKQLSLPTANVQIDVKIADNTAKITILSDKFVRKLQILSDASAAFSDNYFDLLPAVPKVVTLPVLTGSTEDIVASGIKIKHVGLVRPSQSKIRDKLFRLKALLRPWNFVNYIWYKFFM